MNILINLLADNGYILVNKEVIKKLGLHEAILLGELCSEYAYWEKNNKLDNGYFFSTRKNIYDNTSLTPYQQRELFEKLEKMGIILVKNKGIPLTKWYSINSKKFFEIFKFDNSLKMDSQETLQQDVRKLDNGMLRNLTTIGKETLQQDVKKPDNSMLRYLTTRSKETLQHNVKKLDPNNNKNNNNDDIGRTKQKKDVSISRKQYDILIAQYGKERIDRLINRLDLYKKSTGKRYKDDYATLLLWVETDLEKEKKNTNDNSKLDSKEMRLKNLQEKFGENLEKLYANYTAFKE